VRGVALRFPAGGRPGRGGRGAAGRDGLEVAGGLAGPTLVGWLHWWRTASENRS